MFFWFALAFGAAVAFGVWRKFTAVQWIWLLFGTAVTLLVLWFLLIAFVIGPEMVRQGPPGANRP